MFFIVHLLQSQRYPESKVRTRFQNFSPAISSYLIDNNSPQLKCRSRQRPSLHCLSCQARLVADPNPRKRAPSSFTGDTATVTTTEVRGPIVARQDGSLDLIETTYTTWALFTTVTSAIGTVEDVLLHRRSQKRLAYRQRSLQSTRVRPRTTTVSPGSSTPSPSLPQRLLCRWSN